MSSQRGSNNMVVDTTRGRGDSNSNHRTTFLVERQISSPHPIIRSGVLRPSQQHHLPTNYMRTVERREPATIFPASAAPYPVTVPPQKWTEDSSNDVESTKCWCSSLSVPLSWVTNGISSSSPAPRASSSHSDSSSYSSTSHPDSFTSSIRHALIIGYCFSLLYPELHARNWKWRGRPSEWNFLYLVRVVYCAFVIAGLSVQAAFALYRGMISENPWESSVDMMFFGSSMVATLLFLELGPRWHVLVSSFEDIEVFMSEFGYPTQLSRRMKCFTIFVLIGALVEHVLSVLSTVVYSWPCYEQGGFDGLLKEYCFSKFPMTFELVSYSIWKGILVFIVNFLGTFFWNFCHLFIMLMSFPISYRFMQLNDRLHSVRGQVVSETFWKSARETYDALAKLTNQVDAAIGKLIILSFASNMYFICRQLLHSFRIVIGGFWYNAYFTFSFGYMLLRAILVSLCASEINDQSLKPMAVLFSVPSEGYGPEVERFLWQVTSGHIAFTGCRFFSVTRSLVLTVAGTIMSYEIVLMQLHPRHGNETIRYFHQTENCI